MSSMIRRVLVLFVCVLFGAAWSGEARACGTIVRVTFVEASPDLFVIEHLKGYGGHVRSITIDMTPSVGHAFVDTPYGPATPNAGEAVQLDKVSGFATGSQSGQIWFKAFRAGESFSFMVDLDDRAPDGDNNMNVLTANELEGGQVSVVMGGDEAGSDTWSGTFDANGVARIGNRACASIPAHDRVRVG